MHPDGSGRELRRLHDMMLQHLRALKAMDYEPSGPFITLFLELKLDTNMLFEWQTHSQDSGEVPHFQKLLEFINLCAHASEVTSECGKKNKCDTQFVKKTASRPVASFAGAADWVTNCMSCKSGKHPLCACPNFRALSLC